MKTVKRNLIVLSLFCSLVAVGQTKKLNKTFNTDNEVTVKIEGQHTDIEVEYWDQNKVQVEALLKGADQKTAAAALKNWDLKVEAGQDLVQISSSGGMVMPHPAIWDLNLKFEMPEVMVPLQEMISPILESIAAHPLPPEFYASMSEITFDYEAYQKEGDAYMEKFEKKIEKNLGEDFEKNMEKWADGFAKDSVMLKKHAEKMEAWGEKFGKEMEKWGEEFGKDMEKWGEEFGKEMEAMNLKMEENKPKIHNLNNPGLQKILRIKMPNSGKLQLDIRHGEVKLGGTAKDLRADLSHSRFSANHLSGKNTVVKVAYGPVHVAQWNYGVLHAAYVEDLLIDRVLSIKLDSNSSDIRVGELVQNGIFNGSFGELVIDEVAPEFQSLDFNLENTDLILDLPDGTAFGFTYNGNKSDIKYPASLNLTKSDSYDLKKLRGYNKNNNGKATILINADFSDVVLK